jgi:hypothetical protein
MNDEGKLRLLCFLFIVVLIVIAGVAVCSTVAVVVALVSGQVIEEGRELLQQA